MRIQNLLLILFLLLGQSAARTRQGSVESFIDDLRLSVDGYANTRKGEVNITSTTQALQVATLLNYKINNSLDILLFFQESQNDSGGFSRIPDLKPTWLDTVAAVEGLQHLAVNQSQIQNWKVFNYLNQTAMDVLYYSKKVGNETIFLPRNLTLPLMDTWYEYIQSSFLLGFPPFVDYEFLINAAQEYQYSNGSYADFTTATTTIHLMAGLKQLPLDADLASKFIRAYIQVDGAFSHEQEGATSLRDSFFGVRALFELEDIEKIEYKDELIRFLLKLQHTDSGFGEVGGSPTLQDTWYATNILFMMNKLIELNSPDVLQTQGFINSPLIFIPIMVLSGLIYRRKLNG